MKDICLHIPSYKELWYRKKIMSDPETMSYNKGYELNFDEYDQETGCIAFPERAWADWYTYFVGQEPLRFYAYLVRKKDGVFIGEVNLHKNQEHPWHEMGILLEARHRGQGYSEPALKLLLQYAFEKMNVNSVHNQFEATRTAALQTHLAAGFTRCLPEGKILELAISRQEYFRRKTAECRQAWIKEV